MKLLRVPVFVTPAALLVAVFVFLHALGQREHVSVLSGTEPSSNIAGAGGLLYVAAWLSAVVAAPILAIAAAVTFALKRAIARSPPSDA